MKPSAVARPLVVAVVALWMAAHLSGVRAQPSSGTVPLLQSLVDLESVETSMGELVPALPQEALAPASTLSELLELVKAARDKVEEIFCTKPTVTRGKKVDTVIQGPQLNITLSGGNCSVALDLGERQKTLDCVGPSISYSKAPITFTAKHWTADVFEDGSCVKTKAIGRTWSSQQPEEKVLWTAGEHMRFESVEAFLAALKAGALNALFGPEAAAQMAQRAAAAAAAAAAARSQPVQTAAAATAVPTASKQSSLEALLQSAGWEVKMNKVAATHAEPVAGVQAG
ncbi:hypothetical protein C2E21_9496 [Chlorella sorokiniana]|uniref:Uncharacterized protein n=1 Tax=Chlorella sorokiniana TaxID=3076 RepID=A0A2P6TBD8_CHLSO|nr:hypothetical protein C2E21_9496 [Chlorella sorokiniana]|eukprot:PRW05861.1 hypothetical protein C2E21_9496 [Chlorella sorokiniana]